MTENTARSPVIFDPCGGPGRPEYSPELADLHRDLEKERLVPLWAEIGGLVPLHPQSGAQPHVWEWSNHNPTDRPMAWIDGLDIPFAHQTGSTFFEFGDDELTVVTGKEVRRARGAAAEEAIAGFTIMNDGAA